MRKIALVVAALLLFSFQARADNEWDIPSWAYVAGGVTGGAIAVGGTLLQFRPVLESLAGKEPSAASLGVSLGCSALVLAGVESVYTYGGGWSAGKAALLALPFAALITWDIWKLAHPIAAAPVVTPDTQGVALAMRF
jgi:hypothetical protein